jgi:predicted permease
MNKLRWLKIFLYLGAVYYVVGAIVHYFGLTLFPWFDGRLYTPYQDTVIAFVALVLAYFLIVIANDPIKNKDMLKAIIVAAIAASVFSIAIIWKVNFTALGAPDKRLQTIVEGVVGFIWSGALLWLYPH